MASGSGGGLADDGPIAVRVLGTGRSIPIQQAIADRITRADALRADLVAPQGDGYRVVNGAGDGMDGIVVDRVR